MRPILFGLSALFSGLLFGLGMAVSGMADPKKVIAFLDVFGTWDPSLIFVMGGALLVFMPGYFFIVKKRQQPVCAAKFNVPTSTLIDGRLLGGAAIFGAGWGLAGICPGPAIASITAGNPDIFYFIIAMVIALGVTHSIVERIDSRK
ncbi:YeeE/YedE family protein [Vibrio nitrifigilis]|uniref:YeeE/YedE family protein n=1 Tax=Vibrio nitrifigilis TaxID=2789781 RepID=A0ABS0GJY9_9VIBR|nr:YeeE/YedE family protein [Vibrio nitrifigilis]MBF9002728.1 YeeE/YedE family protein [Vibrio nitrifigilis]